MHVCLGVSKFDAFMSACSGSRGFTCSSLLLGDCDCAVNVLQEVCCRGVKGLSELDAFYLCATAALLAAASSLDSCDCVTGV